MQNEVGPRIGAGAEFTVTDKLAVEKAQPLVTVQTMFDTPAPTTVAAPVPLTMVIAEVLLEVHD